MLALLEKVLLYWRVSLIDFKLTSDSYKLWLGQKWKGWEQFPCRLNHGNVWCVFVSLSALECHQWFIWMPWQAWSVTGNAFEWICRIILCLNRGLDEGVCVCVSMCILKGLFVSHIHKWVVWMIPMAGFLYSVTRPLRICIHSKREREDKYNFWGAVSCNVIIRWLMFIYSLFFHEQSRFFCPICNVWNGLFLYANFEWHSVTNLAICLARAYLWLTGALGNSGKMFGPGVWSASELWWAKVTCSEVLWQSMRCDKSFLFIRVEFHYDWNTFHYFTPMI